MDYLSHCENMATPIDIRDLLDENDNVNLLPEGDFYSRQDVIRGHLEKQQNQLSEIELTSEWKFLSDPENNSFEQKCIISGRLITKVYRTPQERDNLLVGYNENFDSENWNDDYVYSDGDEGFLDESARKNFIFTKYLHSRLINGIKANTENLSKLEIAQSCFFAIPKPNVPTLVPGTGLNTEIKQNSDSNVVKGIENKLRAARDNLAETFDCSFGLTCSSDLDKKEKNQMLEKIFQIQIKLN